jgi:hypothetical protein
MLTNYFENRLERQTVRSGRPYVHSTALARFQTFAPIHFPVERALDVGCGTGQSTKALLRFAESETTHNRDESFDLITVAPANPSGTSRLRKYSGVPPSDSPGATTAGNGPPPSG